MKRAAALLPATAPLALAFCAAPREDMNAAEEPAEATVRYQETVGRVTTEQTHVCSCVRIDGQRYVLI